MLARPLTCAFRTKAQSSGSAGARTRASMHRRTESTKAWKVLNDSRDSVSLGRKSGNGEPNIRS
jgi:hypothetical protein